MNTMTPPKKGLKTRRYSMDMEDHINQIKAVTSCSTHKIDQQETDG